MPARLVCFAALLPIVPLFAADPVEPGEDENAWKRLLAEDTDGLLTIDVKQILASPFVKKGMKGKLPDLLSDRFLVPVRLKPLGVDPTKDLHRVTVMMAASDWKDADESRGGPVILFQTAKSEASLRAALDKLAKDGKGVKAVEEGKHKLYELSEDGRSFVAVLPGGTLGISPGPKGLAAALARSKAPRKALKHAPMAKFVAALKAGPAVQGIVLPEAVVGASGSASDDGMGKVVRTFKTHTFGESTGFSGARVVVTGKDTLKGTVTLECKDEDTAKKKAKEVTGGITLAQLTLGGQVMMVPQLKAVIKILESAKVKVDGKSVTIDGEVEPEAAAVLDLLDRGPGGRPVPPPPPVEKVEKKG